MDSHGERRVLYSECICAQVLGAVRYLCPDWSHFDCVLDIAAVGWFDGTIRYVVGLDPDVCSSATTEPAAAGTQAILARRVEQLRGCLR